MFYKKNINFAWLCVGLAVFVCGMAAAGMWDLALDTALYNPTSTFAIAMECLGFLPIYLPVLFWLDTLLLDRSLKKPLRIGALVLRTAGFLGLAAYILHNFQKRGVTTAAAVSVVLFALLSLIPLWLCARSEALRKKLVFVMRWGTIYMILDNAVINVLKLIWARTRFDDMYAAGSFDAFTAWWQPFGNGGTSFPSGHTASACSILVLVLLCDVFASLAKKRTLVWTVCWGYIAMMAYARILIGRHFLSDTLAAAFVMLCLFFVMVKSKWYKAGLQQLES